MNWTTIRKASPIGHEALSVNARRSSHFHSEPPENLVVTAENDPVHRTPFRRSRTRLVKACLIAVSALMISVLVAGCRPPAGPDGATADGDSSETSSAGLPFSIQEVLDWSDQFDEMQAVLNLNDEQQAQLQQTFEEETAKVRTWYEEEGVKLLELNKKFSAAVRKRDRRTMRQITEQAKPLQQTATLMHRDLRRAILDGLPDDKREQWQIHVVTQRFYQLIESIELTPEQEETVGQLMVTAVRRAADSDRWVNEGVLNMERILTNQVLRGEQRTQWEEFKKENPLWFFNREE